MGHEGTGDTTSRSRGAWRPSFSIKCPSSEQRAQGRPGAGWHPWSACNKKARGRTTGTSRTTGLPCAMVLRLIRDLPGETGRCCHRCLASSPKAQHLHRGAGTTRFRRTRFVVRLTTRRVHRIPLPTFVTIAKRPSYRVRDARSIVVICPTTQEQMCTTGNLRMGACTRCRMGKGALRRAHHLSASKARW
jgi:hypothetical protein